MIFVIGHGVKRPGRDPSRDRSQQKGQGPRVSQTETISRVVIDHEICDQSGPNSLHFS